MSPTWSIVYLEYSIGIWLDKPEIPLKPIDMEYFIIQLEYFHYSTILYALEDTQGGTQGMVLVQVFYNILCLFLLQLAISTQGMVLVQVFYNIHVPFFIVI